MMRPMLVALAAMAVLLQDPAPRPQDPQRPPPPPAGAPPLPPVEADWVEPVLRDDLAGHAGPRDPLEGFWQLRERTVSGEQVEAGQGCMAIGRRYLMVQFQAPGPGEDQVLLRSGTYRWNRTDEFAGVRLVTAFGWFNDEDDDMHFEPAGDTQQRRFELHDDQLRVYQDDGSWLGFARLE